MDFILKLMYYYLILKIIIATGMILFDLITSPNRIEYNEDC
jgi:hypothetical protein